MADKLKAAASAMKAAAKLSKNKSETVKVCVRVRPMSSKEKQDGRDCVTVANTDRGEMRVRNPRADASEPPKVFTFDATFGPDVKQRHVYDTCAAAIVDNVMEGFNGTVFAYGQTGAGKSFTMTGANDPPELQGIIPNSFTHIFTAIDAVEGKQYLVRASFLEIYNENIRDLLSKDPNNTLDLKESVDSGVYVKDLTSFVVKSAAEIDGVMQAGNKNRSVGATLMNQTSSRSHSIFTIIVECGSKGVDGEDHICVGKLNMVDLAGSERQSKTGATGDRLKEATKINLSLSALGNVISALVDGKSSHIPYRDSKLTRLLQDSLGGNTKTVMIANCGPADYNYDETLTTLRYANRAKNIKNKPKINEDPKDAMLREFQDEIIRLRQQLAQSGTDRVGEMAAAGKLAPMMLSDGKAVPIGAQVKVEKEVQEKVVVEEKVVVKREGVTEEELKTMQDKALAEKKAAREQAQKEVKEMMRTQARTKEERDKVAAELEKEKADASRIEEEKAKVEEKLRAMEEKLIQGGKLMDKAAKQEIELRRANVEIEERKRQEQRLQRELEEKQQAELAAEQTYSSLQEEVDVKTKKLKKLWTKFQEATTECSDLQQEFQREKEDMLDTIRQLTRQIQLKQKIVDLFVPKEMASQLQERASLDDRGQWALQSLSNDPADVFPARPVSFESLRRPETEYSRSRKAYDANPRYKYDNIINLELDTPERTTQDYQGPAMMQRVQEALSAALEGDEEDLQFDGGGLMENLPDFNKSKEAASEESSKKKEKRTRPKSGRRRKEERERERDRDKDSSSSRKARPKSGRRRNKEERERRERERNGSAGGDSKRDRDAKQAFDLSDDPIGGARVEIGRGGDRGGERERGRNTGWGGGQAEERREERGRGRENDSRSNNAAQQQRAQAFVESDEDMESEVIGAKDKQAEADRLRRQREMDKQLEREHVHYRDRGRMRDEDAPPKPVQSAW